VPDLHVVLLLVAAAAAAGWFDAVSGGGGLVQLPALLVLLPGATPAQILATNKLSGVCGTSVAAGTYYRGPRCRWPGSRSSVPPPVRPARR